MHSKALKIAMIAKAAISFRNAGNDDRHGTCYIL